MAHPTNHTFSEKEVDVIDRALDIAWHRFLQTGMMDENSKVEAQQLLTQRIIRSVAEGECDHWKLAREALFNLWEIMVTGKPLIKMTSHKSSHVSAHEL
jgi:hypothetical protein